MEYANGDFKEKDLKIKETQDRIIEMAKAISTDYNFLLLVGDVVFHGDFKIWSGSSVKSYIDDKPHHYGYGGLIQHTKEVIEIGITLIDSVFKDKGIDKIEFFLAALYHDFGKIKDYERRNIDPYESAYIWAPSKHKRLIGHISSSAIDWTRKVEEGTTAFYRKYHRPVLHAILAHHGGRTHGSPVAPKTRVAWLLHTADQMSARIDDADRIDVVERYG